MTYIASHDAQAHNAKEIAEKTHLALPTVSKLLKILAKNGLLLTQRGSKGGYRLALAAEKISLAQIIAAIEGTNIALTTCSHTQNTCHVEGNCAIRKNWRIINDAIQEMFATISLMNMTNTLAREEIKNILQKKIPALS